MRIIAIIARIKFEIESGRFEVVHMDKDKVEHLLEHWIEHNEGHSESFRKWAVKIRDMGFVGAADAIIQAANAMDESTVHLLEAQNSVNSDDG